MSDQEFGRILIYQNQKGDTRIDVYIEGDTIWMSQKNLAQLYQVDVRTINEHIKGILAEGELREATIRNFRIVQTEGPLDTQEAGIIPCKPTPKTTGKINPELVYSGCWILGQV